ncbi:MAG: hypothetical protein ACE5JS_16275 [Nitrospinota bacterium]
MNEGTERTINIALENLKKAKALLEVDKERAEQRVKELATGLERVNSAIASVSELGPGLLTSAEETAKLSR